VTSCDAFAPLVAAHQQAVRAFLRRLCGDAAEADDLPQDVFIAAWTGLDGFRRGENFRLWLYGIAYRKFLASRRAAGRRRNREARAAEIAETVAHPDAHARLDLQRAMMALSKAQRAAVALCLAAGVSHGDAAALLGLPLGTVKAHVTRGRAILLSTLDPDHDR
jgi:RNA polymerase sigma-70 factor (ECF subfamily)